MTLRDAEGPRLRLTEQAEATPGRYRVEVALEGDGPRKTATSSFDLAIDAQDRADLRWYLEDYLLFPFDPAPEIAARIEKRMAELGEALFRGVFLENRDATRLWDRIRERLAETRVEVVTDVRHAASIPWELLRDPETSTPVALEAHAFVRAHGSPLKFARGVEAAGTGPIRILLVICRPRGGKDVPFRSVAAKLLKGLDKASREVVALDVLRPPTFDMLSRTLRDAKDRGKPYHVVHFDGHGVYTDEPEKVGEVLVALGGAPKGAHGYLAFESSDEALSERGQLVDGPSLGKLLYQTSVPVLVLNACRSAHADPPQEPEKAATDSAGTDTHGDIASFGSLALEVMDQGVSGVVAMRYKVYVVTAAQFVADLYGALAGGLALGEAVTRGRKQLAAQPMRTIAYDPCAVQDWPVPIVYEAERLPLFPAPVSQRGLKLTLHAEEPGEQRATLVDVPPAPDAGFFGRDETLLALDRAFDKHRVVLLHANAGSGKSSAAAEFARWYTKTGGVDGPALWTSFERRMPLPQVLDLIGRVFEPVLVQNELQWLALSDADRRKIALQVLAQRPVLWIWDRVEPVAGFPAGPPSAWSAEEQRELVDFLRDARETKARFLLTSRRDEQAWLGELPARIEVPEMPMHERVQLARALAEKRGARLDQVADWRPLLNRTKGNPQAITELVGQALRDGVRTREQVKAFMQKLRGGPSEAQDEVPGPTFAYGGPVRPREPPVRAQEPVRPREPPVRWGRLAVVALACVALAAAASGAWIATHQPELAHTLPDSKPLKHFLQFADAGAPVEARPKHDSDTISYGGGHDCMLLMRLPLEDIRPFKSDPLVPVEFYKVDFLELPPTYKSFAARWSEAGPDGGTALHADGGGEPTHICLDARAPRPVLHVEPGVQREPLPIPPGLKLDVMVKNDPGTHHCDYPGKASLRPHQGLENQTQQIVLIEPGPPERKTTIWESRAAPAKRPPSWLCLPESCVKGSMLDLGVPPPVQLETNCNPTPRPGLVCCHFTGIEDAPRCCTYTGDYSKEANDRYLAECTRLMNIACNQR